MKLDDPAWHRVVASWQQESELVQERIAQICGEIDRPYTCRTLVSMLETGREPVVIAAADSLQQLPEESWVDMVSPAAVVRLRALAGIDTLNGQVAQRLLRTVRWERPDGA